MAFDHKISQWRTMFLFKISLLVSSSVFASPGAKKPVEAFTGAQACSHSIGGTGYTDIETLNNDMFSNAFGFNDSYESTTYVLCPNVEFSISVPIIPMHDKTIIKCGSSGSSYNNCVLNGGEFHIYFHEHLRNCNMEFHGLTFKNSNMTSVGAYSEGSSSATFIDCLWMENTGSYMIHSTHVNTVVPNRRVQENLSSPQFQKLAITTDIPQKTQQKEKEYITRRTESFLSESSGMSLKFEDCFLHSNRLDIGLISTFGGKIELNNCLILSNIATAVLIGVANEGELFVKDTNVKMNTNHFSTFFVDQTSSFKVSYDIALDSFSLSGKGNSAEVCPGIFIEKPSSLCLTDGGYKETCFGVCCSFNDSQCLKKTQTDDPIIHGVDRNRTFFVFNETD